MDKNLSSKTAQNAANYKKQALLIVGSVAYDSLETPFKKIARTLGGSGSYFILAASYFFRPAIIAVVGDDFLTSDKKILSKHADISGLSQEAGKTFHWAGKYHYDLNTRDTLKTELGVFANFKPNLSPAHKKARYVFLGNIHPKLQLKVLSQIQRPKFVGLDSMNFWMDNAPKQLREVLKKINIFIINDSEARQFSGEHNLVKAARKILGIVGKSRRASSANSTPSPTPSTLIIKRGEYGLLMFQQSSLRVQPKQSKIEIAASSDKALTPRNDKQNLQTFHLPGYPLEDVTDPTGAGDSFAGGFMGYLAKTDNLNWENLKKACVAGSVMASFCVEKLGTKSLQEITKDDIAERFDDFKNLTSFTN